MPSSGGLEGDLRSFFGQNYPVLSKGEGSSPTKVIFRPFCVFFDDFRRFLVFFGYFSPIFAQKDQNPAVRDRFPGSASAIDIRVKYGVDTLF